MNTRELLHYLHSIKVQITVKGDKLKIHAPTGVITDSLKAQILAHKPHLIAYLGQHKTTDDDQSQDGAIANPPRPNLTPQKSKVSPDCLKTQRTPKREQAPLTTITPIHRDSDSLMPSYGQYRMWFLSALKPATPSVYHLYRFLRLQGTLDRQALQQALDQIIARHEVVRTCLVHNTAGELVQRIMPPVSFPLTFHDLRTHNTLEQARLADDLLHQDANRPFDLGQDLMLRGLLLRLSDGEHLLQLTTHHVASDRWSLGLLTQELTTLYGAFVTGQTPVLPALPIQYADFAAWQRDWLSGELLQAQLRYWQSHLLGAPPVLPLPTDYPRPPVVSFRGAWQLFSLSRTLTDQLKQMGQEMGATLYMVLLSAFYVMLYRYTQQQDIVVGTAIANRQHTQLEKLIGYFANTLALRGDLSGEPTFREVVARVRQMALDAYAHQDTPFEQLVEALQPERNLSYSPIFQTMFIMLNTPRAAHELADISGLSIQEERISHNASQFDCTFFVGESEAGLEGVCEYSTDLFTSATIDRMIGHYRVILEQVVCHPDQAIATLPILTAEEQQQLLCTWNDTQRHYPDQSVCQLFEAQVQRTPQAIAVQFDQQRLTYQELNDRANQLAHHLRSLGVGADTFVGVCLERSLELVIALLATLKAGGAYVPIDPAYPPDRVAYMLANAEAKVLLTQASLSSYFTSEPRPVIALDRDWKSQIAPQPKTNLAHTIGDRQQLAYVIFTSGSTGKPKGVLISHGSLSNFLLSMQDYFPLTPQDKLVAVTTISFDIAALELYLPLITGAQVILTSCEGAMDAQQLSKLINSSGATILQATPATWFMLLAIDWQPKIPFTILCGGEPLPPNLAAQLRPLCKELWNMYGPTETTIWSSLCQVQGDQTPITIGKPIANTQFYILDPHLQPVPIGVTGELYIGGAGLAQGYLKRPDLTAEKFVDNPIDPHRSPRLYRTGDLARWRSSGEVECLGRVDFQVKIRGFRIELGEIEAALMQHPQLDKVVVVAREAEGIGMKLVAYLIAPQAIPVSELTEFLKETLPDYMVPSAFVFLETFPLTPNGKVDRKALPDPSFSRDIFSEQWVAPRTAIEAEIADIWANSLNLDQVGIHDNFFEIGGNSLLAVKVFAEIEKKLQKKIPLHLIFQQPTIAEIAQFGTTVTPKPKFSSLVALQSRGSKPPLFCTHAIGTSVHFYRQLTEYLGTDQPFYGLQSCFLDQSEQKAMLTLEDMAAFYIQEIQTIQAEGPYFLGGYSFGGRVVYEMAQQLRKAGHQVALLAIIDTLAPGGLQRLSQQQQLLEHWRNFRNFGIEYATQKASRQINFRAWQMQRFLKKRMEAGKLNRSALEHQHLSQSEKIQFFEARLRRVEELHTRTVNAYQFNEYSGKITLFRSEVKPDNVGDVWEDTLGWQQWAKGGLEIHDIPGHHYTIFEEPNVQVLAAKLKLCLEQAIASL